MPHFHIAQSWGLDYDEIERRAAEGNGPRHGPPLLAAGSGRNCTRPTNALRPYLSATGYDLG